MRKFSRQEIVALFVILLILVGVSWPNFALSLRRARDQVRRDDIGNIQAAIDAYYSDFGIFPSSTPDGKIVACKGSAPEELAPCNWGQDTWISLDPKFSKVYMRVISGDPDKADGVSYVYFSDGSRYQLMAALESSDEPGYDAKLTERNVNCGSRLCNMGRNYNVPLYISIEEYNLQIYCGTHPKDINCINRK